MINQPKRGSITYSPQWELTPKRQAALTRLAELGVHVFSGNLTSNFTVVIPHQLTSLLYIEIGYLLAQLGNETFPDGCETLSDVPSQILPTGLRADGPVYFVDSHPHGLKYRITPRQKDE